MQIASPAPIAPLQLRGHVRRGRPSAIAAAPAVRPPRHEAAFQAFVDENRHLFADYVARRLHGQHAGAAEDALQDGLIQIWKEWAEWPADDSERIRFAREALRIAALTAIRKRTGRDGSARAGEIVTDFSSLDTTGTRPSPGAEQLARDLGRAIAEQSMVKDQFGYLERASLIAAIATLTDLEQRVLFMTAQGDDCKQIATDLGVTHQQAREALMRARRLCRMLIEHADGQKLTEPEAKALWQYRDGQLSGKRARELKRHIDHCTACQRLLGLEDSIGTNGALVILPIPVLLLALGKTAAGTAATVGGGTSAATGTSAGVQLGGTLLAPAAPTTTFGSVLAGITAKVAVGLAGLATSASIAGVYKLAHDRQAHARRPTAAAVIVQARELHDAVSRIPQPSRAVAVKHRKTPRRSSRPHINAPAKSKVPARHPAPVRTTPVLRSPQPAATQPTARAARSTPRSSGSEFLLGGN